MTLRASAVPCMIEIGNTNATTFAAEIRNGAKCVPEQELPSAKGTGDPGLREMDKQRVVYTGQVAKQREVSGGSVTRRQETRAHLKSPAFPA